MACPLTSTGWPRRLKSMIKWIRLLSALFALGGAFGHFPVAHAEDFLDPDAAVKFSARALDANTLEARWQIADGYYMYRDKFKFEVDGATLGTPQRPAGKEKHDDNFGTVETYRKDVRIALPIQRAAGVTSETLKTVSQGCADAGLCYTPQSESVTIKLPAAVAAAAALPAASAVASAPSALDRLRSLGGDTGMPQLLPPDEAFLVKAAMPDAQTVKLDYAPTANTYLYRDKLAFVVKSPADIKITRGDTPAGDIKDDPSFGRTEVYHHNFSASLALSRALAGNETLVLAATWQGCNEAVGVCYPPIMHDFSLTAEGAAAPVATSDRAASPAGPVAAESDTSKIERVLKGGSFWAVVATFFGFGLLLALPPCVFPMLPLISGIIAGQNKELPKASGFLLSLAYVLGMAITYALAGVAAALSGTLLSNALQNPWALGIGAGIFVLLALSMFGFFELQLPSFIQSKFSDASNKMKGGNFVGVFVMGALSAVIVGPCVAPPLAAALAFIAQTGNTTLGGVALFVLALGMGVPSLLVGLSAGALLPRAGGWMNAVKYFFGVVMLVGVLSIILGMLAGSRDLLQPLEIYKGSVFKGGAGGIAMAAEQEGLAFERVKSVAELDTRLAAAKAEGRAVMLDFYADWCVSCKEMEHLTFSDPKVQARLHKMVLLQVDVTATTDADKALLKRFNLFGPPGLIFWDGTGAQSDYKVSGFEKADKFLASINSALGQ